MCCCRTVAESAGVREGGMVAEGIQLPQLGEGSSIVVALVSLTVCVE